MHAKTSAKNRFDKRDILVLACIELSGLIARLVGIRGSYNYDEVFSLQAANGSWRHAIQTAIADRTHPPLHLLLLHIWIHVFGSSEAATRSLSVVFSLLFLIYVWKIARQYFSFAAAVTASAICALSPFLIHFGIESRPYSLIAFLSVLSVDRMLAWISSPQRPLLAVSFSATATCLVLAQYPGAVLVGAEIALLIFLYRFRLATALLFPLIILPGVAWFALAKILIAAPISDRIGWIERPSVAGLFELPFFILGWIDLRHASILLYSLLLVALYGLISRFRAQNAETKKHIVSLAVLSLSVPVALYVLSVLPGISYWAERQMIGSVAVAMLLIGAGVASLPLKIRGATFVLLAGWTMAASCLDKPAVMGPPWREIASDIRERYPGRPLVASEVWCSVPLEHYTNATVELSDAVAAKALDQRAVFVCRSIHCSFIAQDPRLKRAMTYNDWSQFSTTPIWVFEEK